MSTLFIPYQEEIRMDDKEKWEAIYNLSKIPKWGYEETSWGKKILAKKFEIFGGEVHDFTIYRLERLIDDSWETDGTDAYILAEILEAYLSEDVYIEWVEGFPMAMPNISDSDFLDDLDFDPFS
jgi:hypothetical protein